MSFSTLVMYEKKVDIELHHNDTKEKTKQQETIIKDYIKGKDLKSKL